MSGSAPPSCDSEHRSAELIERVGWAVHDADENEAVAGRSA